MVIFVKMILKMKNRILVWMAVAGCLIGAFPVLGQKKAMDHDVYDGWQRVDGVQLSPDGRVLVYQINPQEGDGELIVRNSTPLNKNGLRLPGGKPRSGRASAPAELRIPRGYSAQLDPMGLYLYCRVKPPFATTRREKIDKKKAEDQTKDSLAVVDLVRMTLKKYPAVTAFGTGFDSMPFVAYKSEWKVAADTVKKVPAGRKEGLIVLDPAAGRMDTVLRVDKFVFDRTGSLLAYSVKKDKKDTTTASAMMLASLPGDFGRAQALSRDAAFYGTPVFSDDGIRVAWTESSDTNSTGNKRCSLMLAERLTQDSGLPAEGPRLDVQTLSEAGASVPGTEDWTLNENSSLTFSKSGRRLFLGIAPIRPPKDTSIVDFETAQLDIWNWDAYLTPPQQKLRLDRTLKKTYDAVLDVDADVKTIRLLSDSFFEGVRYIDGGDGDYAVALDDTKYMVSKVWDYNSFQDVYKVDLRNGNRELLFEKLNGTVSVSPEGKYLLWYSADDQHWHSYDIARKQKRNLTEPLGVAFYDEENDSPTYARPYSSPFWVTGDRYVILSDRYDLWRIDPATGAAENLTKGEGRSRRVQFRCTDPVPARLTEAESRLGIRRTFAPDDRIFVTSFQEDDKRNGIGRIRIDKPAVPEYSLDTVSYTGLLRAPGSEELVFQKGNFRHPYDLYRTTDDFRTAEKLTALNPQMNEYRWGSAELFAWKAYDGTPLKGLVFIPDGIKPGEKLPVMVYFYEKNSESLYNFRMPAPSRSTVNIPFFCSRGYVVFVPDIVYKVGHPGESALNCICSGAEALCEKYSFADKGRMAIQGQSWGGYQTAWLVTRTNMFAAAGAGAPVSNMTSAYGGIRWESGITRAGQYEHGQSRIGKSLWDEGGLELYLENSPIFRADRVETPLLIMHNDNDGAVPWYQGIELFSDLRRLGKPVWMLQYNNEAHNLSERRNSKDLSIRLQQFFDHYLLGAPMPAWMKTGVPADRKGEYFGFELVP
jgi:dipeptidyl aminopeptidase/acylaminoacyl peptidase